MNGLRHRVRAGERLLGTFVKTTSPQTIEVLAHGDLDFIVPDAEHAPFSIESLSQALAVAIPNRLPTLVRTPSHDPAFINSCLDMGAEGVLVPHVRSVADVEAIADAVKYRRGRRGFSPSTRAGAYGTFASSTYRSMADDRNAIWCQIEDAEALEALDAIAAHDAVDCLFIGPADLGWSLCPDGPDEATLLSAIRRIVSSASRCGCAVGIFVPDADQLKNALAWGASVIVSGSDQSMLLSATRSLSRALAEAGRS